MSDDKHDAIAVFLGLLAFVVVMGFALGFCPELLSN